MSEELFQRTRSSLLIRLRQMDDAAAWNSAWETFYSRYVPMILAWCRRWDLQSTDAEEIASGVLFTLGRRMQSFDYDPSSRFRGWLKTVVENEIRAFLGRRNRRAGDFARGGDEDQQDHALSQLADPSAAAEELAEQLDEQRSLLRTAMEKARERVQPETWLAFEQTAILEMDATAVAQQLGMSVVAVYKAKSRVQEHIRGIVDQLRRNS